MAAELGSYKQAHTSSPPLTLGNSRVVEGPAPSQGAGFQSPSYAWRDWVAEAPATTATQTTLHRPSWTFLRVVSLLEGGPTPFRAEPGRVPWAKTRPPGARLRAPNPRPGSRVGPRGDRLGSRQSSEGPTQEEYEQWEGKEEEDGKDGLSDLKINQEIDRKYTDKWKGPDHHTDHHRALDDYCSEANVARFKNDCGDLGKPIRPHHRGRSAPPDASIPLESRSCGGDGQDSEGSSAP
ncbi:hypothetical protein L3Q82_012103 [Scortum barcoo]|uniref:Uncharacterized protein n=1 Tax=Scortum barcoo TaxID=214431 RepID=A0ACB8W6Y8_9TELE|nr:hypothetical protein L3Q82_012103 [Scortum barcoo]